MSDSSGGGTSYISVSASPAPGFAMQFEQFRGEETLGRPFLFELDVSSTTGKADLASMLGASMTLSITKADKTTKRYFNGIIARARFGGVVSGSYRYHFELRPKLWLMSHVQDCKIFQNNAVFDIIKSVLSANGVDDIKDNRKNQAGSNTLEYCVQFNETSLDFITRLMEVYGIYYFFEHSDGQHKLVLADDPSSHTAISGSLNYAFKQTEYRTTDAHIWGWVSDQNLESATATFRDYNFTTPSADLTSKSMNAGSQTQYASLEMYEYPGAYGTTGDGSTIAAVRAKRFNIDRQTYHATSNSRDLICGCKFTMDKYSEDALNQDYTVTGARYRVDTAEGVSSNNGELPDTFRCELDAIPGTVQFCLPCETRWPVMRGPQTALVVGNDGEEITTDQYGRIKVQFYWDRDGQKNENSSCWIRVAQIWTGLDWGTMFIPRMGQEVIVEFLDGNPDRPIVTGCVYNATNTIPYAQPDNKTRSTIKTNSSKDGGGYNELRFEDLKGSEEVYFQAQKDYNKVVLNNETVKITQNTDTTVDKGNRSITLNEGNNTYTVTKGTHTETIYGDFSSTVQNGKYALTVSTGDASTTISTGKNALTVSTGDNSTTVSTGNNALTVSTGNHSETISLGNYSISVSAGSYSLSAAQAITIKSDMSITLQVGGNSISISTTGITVNGSMISFAAQEELSANGGGMMTLQAGMININ